MIYAYEVDGFGNAHFMVSMSLKQYFSHLSFFSQNKDDANIPSLLSLPLIGYTAKNDTKYTATRKFLLSNKNPYYFSGKVASGIGGPHVGMGYIWPMGLMTQILTSEDDNEIMVLLNWLKGSALGTGYMHEVN